MREKHTSTVKTGEVCVAKCNRNEYRGRKDGRQKYVRLAGEVTKREWEKDKMEAKE